MFADHYDEVMPKDAVAEQTADVLADLARGRGPALELGVGTGRIALPLARRIGTVVGVDFSQGMLDQLERDTKSTGENVRSVLADMRDYADGRAYPLVYCVTGTLSGLTDPEDQRRSVLAWARHLAPDGLLVLEMQNPEAVALIHGDRTIDTVFQAHPDNGTGVLVSRVLDTERSLWRVSSAYFGASGVKVSQETCRLTPPEELDGHAAEAGLESLARFGDWHRGPVEPHSGTYISVYRSSAGG
ncbi:class I SAM-dependent methyltransferase [Nocardiopsis sp. YSL2]|uniref:class I SAM-dependent DNA methyltransferase n=1 Tax=Nocardiopsis sp. YSL2 TaxID=2939492 RepID=UPI0026F425A3|nr:class I SAM-dependent methyltransferase [Nocardiopsis sp. YSL2]